MNRFQTNDRGVTLVETMIAVLVAFIAIAAIGTVVFSSMVTNENQGLEGTRLTALAQAKMEALLALPYGDTTTNTTGLTDLGFQVGLTSNASTDLNLLPGCGTIGADFGYVDFLDKNGSPFAQSCAAVSAGGYGYERRWKITDVILPALPGTYGLKQITVVVYDLNAINTSGSTNPAGYAPYVTLTSFKSQ
jgi:Flp pilus assembly pilin Flp